MVTTLSVYFTLLVIQQKYHFNLKFMCRLYNYIYVTSRKLVNLICEKFPKIVFRFLDFQDLYPFTLEPANYNYNDTSEIKEVMWGRTCGSNGETRNYLLLLPSKDRLQAYSCFSSTLMKSINNLFFLLVDNSKQILIKCLMAFCPYTLSASV